MTFSEINARIIGGKHHGAVIPIDRGRTVALPNPLPLPAALADFLAFSGDPTGASADLSEYRLETIATRKRRIYFWVPVEVLPEDVPEHLVGMALKATR